jgi:hypothetical protein
VCGAYASTPPEKCTRLFFSLTSLADVQAALGTRGLSKVAPGYVDVSRILRQRFECVERTQGDMLVVPDDANLTIPGFELVSSEPFPAPYTSPTMRVFKRM